MTLIGAIIPDFHPWQHYVDVTSAFICGCVFMFLIMTNKSKILNRE